MCPEIANLCCQDRREALSPEVVETYLADNVKAREMHSDGSYSRRKAGRNPVNSQDVLLKAHLPRPRRSRGS